jgi:predicted amidohydrolase YtcJ
MSCDCHNPLDEAWRAAGGMKRSSFVALSGGLVAASLSSRAFAAAAEPDTILINGRFHTIDPGMHSVEAVAIAGGRFSATGTSAAVLATRGAKTRVVDMKGATVLPGFVEPHMHFTFAMVDALMENVRVSICPTLDSVLAKLKTYAAQKTAGQWLYAFGFDNSLMPPYRQLSLADLDSVSTEVPIFVLNPSGHIAYANSKAFALSGITAATPNVAGGGRYGKDANGQLSGVIYEPPAFPPFLKPLLSPAPTSADLLGWYTALLKKASKVGVTTVHDAGIGVPNNVPADWALYSTLVNAPDSAVRISSMPDFQEHASFDATVAKIARKPGAPIFFADGKFSVPCVKFWSDGSLQGYTGALTEPYVGRPNDKGALNYTTAALTAQFAEAKAAGWSVACHANGDAGIDMALDAFEANFGKNKPAGFRNRVEHCTIARPDQWVRLQAQGLAMSFTEGHVYTWGNRFATAILGETRSARIDNAHEAKSRGLIWSMNSDYAVTDIDPLHYIQTAVMRIPQGASAPLGPEGRVSVGDALRAMTINGAIQIQLEDRIGSIEVGKDADLVELGADPMTVNSDQIAAIPVMATWLRGTRFPQ